MDYLSRILSPTLDLDIGKLFLHLYIQSDAIDITLSIND